MVEDEREIEVSGFSTALSTLNKYKELLTVIIFFVGGVLWIFGYFATKSQLKEVKCLMNSNIEVVQSQMDISALSQMFIENLQEQTNLKNTTDIDSMKLAQLEFAARDLGNKIDIANTKKTSAMSKLKSGQCGG